MAFTVSQWEQTVILLYALFVGALIGALYDIFRLSRVMLTGVGIGGNKTSSQRLEAVIQGLRSEKKADVGRRIKIKRRLKAIKDSAVGVIIFFEDILFFLISSLLLTVFLFQVNFGELRLYIYLGTAAGFLLYYNTVGRISAVFSGVAVSFVRLVLNFTFYKIAKPILSIIAKAISVPVDAYTVRRIITSSDREASKLLVMSEKGFGFNKSTVRRTSGGLSTKLSERGADNEAGKGKNKFSG